MARALLAVGVVAAGVVLVLALCFMSLVEWINRTEPARVAVVVPTCEVVVVRTGVGSRPRSYLVPAQTRVILPPGDDGTIEILDDGRHLLGTVVLAGGVVPWQLVTVGPGDATVALSMPDATLPPFPEAEPTDLCR